MCVTLSDEQYAKLKTALTTIARTRCVNKRGNEQPLNREKVNLMAREACDLMGWPYYGPISSAVPKPNRESASTRSA